MKPRRRKQPERSWVEICCFGYSCLQHFWPKIVMRKWLNISATESDFSADTDEGDSDFDSENEDLCGWGGGDPHFGEKKVDEIRLESRVSSGTLPRMRRQKSETIRAQYMETKELRIRVGTWNIGGKLPPDDLDIEDWLDVDEPADVYVIGLQEIVPLNAGNIFGAEDGRPVPKWEYIIRDTLHRVQPSKAMFKCYSDPPSPSKFKPLDDIPDIEEEILHGNDSEVDEEVNPGDETDSSGNDEVHPLCEDHNHFSEVEDIPIARSNGVTVNGTSKVTENANKGSPKCHGRERQFSLPKRADRFKMENSEALVVQQTRKLTRTLSESQRISWSWPELPLDLLAQHVLERRNSIKSLKESRSFKTYSSFKSVANGDNKGLDIALLADIDLESIIHRKRRSPFVRIISKQMVGIFLSIWVRRSLRKHIQNLKVSTVGVGAMGYIGNKGSISVSMSIYQTLFCFICTHLTSGEKHGDELRRNADVREIHRRTLFRSASGIGFPKTIRDHERIIWFGDLNYRINLSYEETRELILRKEWSKLVQKDQLVQELENGHVFDEWKEGTLSFPPTYKYEFNSEKYCGEDPKAGRRTPAWCDRILSFGKGLRLLNYKRSEQMLSDHRPVTAMYMAEVEALCHRKLQKALSFTDAELEDAMAIPNV